MDWACNLIGQEINRSERICRPKMVASPSNRHVHRFMSSKKHEFYGIADAKLDLVENLKKTNERFGCHNVRRVKVSIFDQSDNCNSAMRASCVIWSRVHIPRLSLHLLVLLLLSSFLVPVLSFNLTFGYLPTLSGDYRDKQGLSISGAITAAMNTIKESNLLPNISLVLQWNDTKSDLLHTTKSLTEMICNDVVVIFGPESTCNVEATITSSWNRMLISHKCVDYTVSDKKKFPTFVRTNPPDTQITKSIVALLNHYKWAKFSIVLENTPRWETVAKSLESLAALNNMTINHRETFEDTSNCCMLKMPCCHTSWTFNIVEKTKVGTRIYVFLGENRQLNEFMTTMEMMRLFDKGEYVVISVDWETYTPERALAFLWRNEILRINKDCKDAQSPSQQAAQSLLMVVTKNPDENFAKFSREVIEYNHQPPFSFPRPVILNMFSRHVTMFAANLYDAVMLYANALSRTIRSRNLTDPSQIIEAAKNGRELFENIIAQRKYTSVTGAEIRLDDNGDSEGNYTVLAAKLSNFSKPILNKKTTNTTFSCSFQMEPVGLFQNIDSKSTRFLETDTISWVGKRPPPDEPPCGYLYEKCRGEGDNRLRNSRISAGVLGGIFLLVILCTVYAYRKWKVEQEIAGLVWKINSNELLDTSRNMDRSTSKLSLTSVASYGPDQVFANRVWYHGTMVRIKDLRFSKRREISRSTMKEMRAMREIRNDNINPFIGAVVEPTRIRIVTTYCAKGSLPDILENDDIKLDNMFIASLVYDLIKGMTYLQKTDLHCHGNLKSSNCVVTSRWVLQITDYGLHELRHAAEKDCIGEHEYYRNLFWKAPEFLRNPDSPVQHSQKGDVYAFGIILYEIMSRQEPFGTYKMEPKAIIERIKLVPESPEKGFRPDVKAAIGNCPEYIIKCLDECWAERPEDRPEFYIIKTRLRKMREGMKPYIMDQIMEMLVKYADNLEDLVNERTRLLFEEKQKTEDLLHRMLPKPVADRLAQGLGVEPESYEAVTIYFSDIVGFTKMSAESTPFQVVTFLNDLYTLLDSITQGYDVYKVETIGDAYMVVSGLPLPNGDSHAGEIASMALDLLSAVQNYQIAHRPGESLLLRIGIHTGPVVAGVVGLTMPRYCLFGDTVNTASRMESNGEPLRIHISNECNEALKKIGGYVTEVRGSIPIKGKGQVLTHWLTGTTNGAIKRRPREGPIQAPLFCRPSIMSCNDVSGSMTESRRKSPRMNRADSVVGRRVSMDLRMNNSNGARLSSIPSHANKLSNNSYCYEHPAEFIRGSAGSSFCSSRSTINPPSPTMASDRPKAITQSMKSIRSNRTGNDSLRRSCLLSRSTNTSQVKIITNEDKNDIEYRNEPNDSQNLPHRRCWSLGKFPGDGGTQSADSKNSVSSECRKSVASHGSYNRHFLRVPQHPFAIKSRSGRKESKSLDLFPSDIRNLSNDIHHSATSEERRGLLDNEIVLTIPNGGDTNGNLRQFDTNGFIASRAESMDDNYGTKSKNVVGVGVDALRRSCDSLNELDSDNKKDSTPIAPIAAVKKFIVNLFGVRQNDEFAKNAPCSKDDRMPREKESVV